MGAVFYCLLLALAVALVPATVAHVLAGWSWWTGGIIVAACWAAVMLVRPYWRLRLTDIATYLDRRLPALEESCGLLLQPQEELTGLQRLQAQRVGDRLLASRVPHPFLPRVWKAAGWMGLALVVSIAVGWMGRRGAAARPAVGAVVSGVRAAVNPKVLQVQVRITPPAYTGRAVRRQPGLDVQAEEGALVEWEVRMSAPAESVELVFNGGVRWPLRAGEAGGMQWRGARQALRPGFYQVSIGGRRSELYKFEIIRDEPPRITIRRPKPYTVVDFGDPEAVGLDVQLRDDYGISDASVMVTVSSGRGEAVKFKAQELRWSRPFGGAAYDLAKTLDLPALGLKPGDELYFYCRARDNRGQETKTGTYIISLTDTAQLMGLEGMAMPTDVKPEFFRSERQIIIETEQLLHQKDGLPVSVFKEKSNGLGIDQKLLRLRYGKFLGEEAEEGEALSDTTTLGAFGDATKILDVYTDKHDNAEDATYFEPAVKQQLKATLNEMWGAELRLRTFRPREALPYCYKALRLLKDLQQQSRAFVAKTGVRVTPLNPAKRLTGELTAIRPAGQQLGRDGGMTEEQWLRTGLAVLEGMRNGVMPGEGGRVVLQEVQRRVAVEAAADPGRWLDAYAAVRGMRGVEDIRLVEQAILRLLPAAEAEPAVENGAEDGGLTRQYFNRLKE